MWWVLGTAIASLGIWGLLSVRLILYPQRRGFIPPSPLPHYATQILSAADGQTFDVWVLDPPAPRARILICHGYYANRHQVLDLAEGLRQRGYQVLLLELRGHGSRRGPCTLGVRESGDAEVALQWARECDGLRILATGVLGLSMGGAVVCQIAARDPTIKAVVTDSIYSRLFPVIRRAIRQRYHLPGVPWAWITWWSLQVVLGKRLDQFDPARIADQLHQPLLAIQGGEDRRLVPLLGREFYQRWAGPKDRWFEPAVAHVGMFARHPQEYCTRVADFFDRVLSGDAQTHA